MSIRYALPVAVFDLSGIVTTEALFVVEGHHDEAEQDVNSAIGDPTTLLATHQPQCEATAFHLSPARATVSK